MKDCNQCGKCCQIYGDGRLSATSEDIQWWDAHRDDIARYTRNGQIWMDPVTGEQLRACPWLRKAEGEAVYTCDIYFDRPDDCRQYPGTVADMIKDECEMIELHDLTDLNAAQRKLNQLMDR